MAYKVKNEKEKTNGAQMLFLDGNLLLFLSMTAWHISLL